MSITEDQVEQLAIDCFKELGYDYAFHEMLTNGVPVEIEAEGGRRGERVMLIDFQHPEKNDFLVVKQLTIRVAKAPTSCFTSTVYRSLSSSSKTPPTNRTISFKPIDSSRATKRSSPFFKRYVRSFKKRCPLPIPRTNGIENRRLNRIDSFPCLKFRIELQCRY